MTTDRVLAEILENGLGPAYQEEIRKRYQCDTAEGLFEPEEREYDAGITALAKTLSPEKMSQLAEYEKTCSSLREYAAKYGFLAGLFCGFKQSFTLKHESDGGFAKHVSDEIYKMPQMSAPWHPLRKTAITFLPADIEQNAEKQDRFQGCCDSLDRVLKGIVHDPSFQCRIFGFLLR